MTESSCVWENMRNSRPAGGRAVPTRCEAAAAAKSLQSCPTLCDPIDGNSPGSPVLGIFQARTLEWGAISFSNAWKRKVKVNSLSPVWLFATAWTAAYQVPLSMGFSRQAYWSEVPSPSPLKRDTNAKNKVLSWRRSLCHGSPTSKWWISLVYPFLLSL